MGNVWFVEGKSVRMGVAGDGYLSAPNSNGVARKSDNALDIVFLRLGRRLEDDDITALDIAKSVRDFVDEHIFSVLDDGVHGAAAHDKGPNNERLDEHCERNSTQKIENIFKKNQKT